MPTASPRGPFKSHEWGGALAGPDHQEQAVLLQQLPLPAVQPAASRKLVDRADGARARRQLQPDARSARRPACRCRRRSSIRSTSCSRAPDLFQRAPIRTRSSPTIPRLRRRCTCTASIRCRTARRTTSTTPTTTRRVDHQTDPPPQLEQPRRLPLGQALDLRQRRLRLRRDLTPRPFGKSPFNGAPTVTSDNNPYGQIGDTIVLGPTLLLDVRYGVTRINTKNLRGRQDGFTDYDKFGVPKNLQPFIQIYGAAPVLSNFSGGSGGGSNWTALATGNFGTKHEHQTSHVLTGSITKIARQLDPQVRRRIPQPALELQRSGGGVGLDAVGEQRGRRQLHLPVHHRHRRRRAAEHDQSAARASTAPTLFTAPACGGSGPAPTCWRPSDSRTSPSTRRTTGAPPPS